MAISSNYNIHYTVDPNGNELSPFQAQNIIVDGRHLDMLMGRIQYLETQLSAVQSQLSTITGPLTNMITDLQNQVNELSLKEFSAVEENKKLKTELTKLRGEESSIVDNLDL